MPALGLARADQGERAVARLGSDRLRVELTRLAPNEVIGGWWREVGNSWRAGATLERHNLDEIVPTGREGGGA